MDIKYFVAETENKRENGASLYCGNRLFHLPVGVVPVSLCLVQSVVASPGERDT